MTGLLTLITFILGLVTCLLSIRVAVSFWQKERGLHSQAKKLTGALKWQLIGEAVIGAGTLIFAWAAYTGELSHWSVAQMSALRVVMFVATSGTTLHLFSVVQRLHDA